MINYLNVLFQKSNFLAAKKIRVRSRAMAKHIWCLSQRRRVAQAFLQNKTKAVLLKKESCCAGLTLFLTPVRIGFCVCTSPFLQPGWVTILKLVGSGNLNKSLNYI